MRKMGFKDTCKHLLSLAETLFQWAGVLAGLDGSRREKVATFAIAIAETLARAADALSRLEANPADAAARRQALRDFGRIAGYVETIVSVLKHHLDGRKLAGVKRRLEHLERGAEFPTATALTSPTAMKVHVGQLIAAEGYFRALADSLRA
jgi:hypothetical protein